MRQYEYKHRVEKKTPSQAAKGKYDFVFKKKGKSNFTF